MHFIESFLSALELERYQIEVAQRHRPAIGMLYAREAEQFSSMRITEVQWALAGSSGIEERQNRALLDFLARGRAMCVAAEALDQRLTWETFASIPVGESRIPQRQIPAALRLAGDPEHRHGIEEAHLDALEEDGYLAEEFLTRYRQGIEELGYGSHVDGLQILGGIDLDAMSREGERFLAGSQDQYSELLARHLPRSAGVVPGVARASDAQRLMAATGFDDLLPGSDANRSIFALFGQMGLEPQAEGRIDVQWATYLGSAAGAVCWPIRVPEEVRLGVSTRSGRTAVASFLHEYGTALHYAYTSPELTVEERRLSDASVPLGAGILFEDLLRNESFLRRAYGFPRARAEEFLSLGTLCKLLEVRSDIARLRFDIAFYRDGADTSVYAELVTAATGIRHDHRAAFWQVDPEFTSARRLRGAQLAAVYREYLRNHFDEDWFRNPAAGEFLRELFGNGRRYSAPEVALQLSSLPLSYSALEALD